MSLRIGDAISDGVRRAFTYSGGVLMVLMFTYVLALTGAMNTIFREYLPEEAEGSGELALAFPIPGAAAAVLLLVALVFGFVVSIAMTRILTRDHAELSSVPPELFTRRIGRAVVSMLGASFIIQLAVTVGLVLLVVPGVFLAVSFLFAIYAIGVEDVRAIDSLSRSWELASGNRWGLFALAVIVFVAAMIVNMLSIVFSFVDPLLGQVANLAIMSVVVIVGNGIFADAYVQLREADTGGSGGTESPDAPGAAV